MHTKESNLHCFWNIPPTVWRAPLIKMWLKFSPSKYFPFHSNHKLQSNKPACGPSTQQAACGALVDRHLRHHTRSWSHSREAALAAAGVRASWRAAAARDECCCQSTTARCFPGRFFQLVYFLMRYASTSPYSLEKQRRLPRVCTQPISLL